MYKFQLTETVLKCVL